MAVRTDLANPIQDFDTVWDNHTGLEVETFITEKLKANEDNLITEATFAGTTLTLNRKSGDPITCTVVVADPVYTYGIYAYGLVLNGDYTNIYRQQTSLTTLYRAGKTFHLGVALLGYTDTVGNKNDLTNTHQITITYNDKSMVANVVPIARSKVNTDLEGNITSVTVDDVQTELAWIDVTELFKESNAGQVKVSYSYDVKSGGANTTMSGEYTLPIGTITNEVVDILYKGTIVNNTTSAQFGTDRDDSAYQLRGYVIKNGGTPEQISTKNLDYEDLAPGLNQFYVRAENINNSDVCTDYLAVDIICTVGLTKPVVAINDVKDTIANNGVATLYNLTVYSPEGTDEVLINTYVYESILGNPDDLPESALVKSESIGDSDYDSGVYQTSYKKYMEIPGGGSQYMYVKVNSEWYKYIVLEAGYLDTVAHKEMVVEALDSTLTYYSSGVSLTFDQIKGSANNVFKTKTYFPNDSNISDNLETSDGWVEEDGRTLFRISALETPVFSTPLTLNLQNSFTLEFGFKAYNISNEHEPILTLGNLHLRPTLLCWNTSQNAEDELNNDTFTSRNAQFREDTETHVMVTFKKDATIRDEGIYYPDYLDAYGTEENLTKLDNLKINLLRIYINGGIDREFMISNAELDELQKATLQINPTTADIDFYILRVYNSSCLNFNQVQRNYTSFLKTKTSKQAFYKKNDILGTNGEISFNKARLQYNTIVYVYPSKYKKIDGITNDSGRFPNRAWGYTNNSPAQDAVMKKAHVTLFVNYADGEVNKVYGGRINKGQVKGQGSSAARYLIWNVGYQLNKFKNDDGKKIKSEFIPYEYLGSNNRFIEEAKAIKGYYVMPKYEGEKDQFDYLATKLVGKVNFASSMQSHKIGACKLYDDAFKNYNKMPTTAATTDTCYGSKKAVHEEPFLYFYWEPDMDNDAVDNVELADVIAAGQDVRFMGFHTWGPAKKDKAYFGYSDYTPEYILIEGGENKDPAANFRVPWHALQRANEDLTADTGLSTYKLEDYPTTPYNPNESWKRLLILDESICYKGTTGALDLDFGAKDDPTIATADETITYWEIADSAHSSINKFREFYDFVYVNDFTTKWESSSTVDTSTWNTSYKYAVSASTFTGFVGNITHTSWDIYRYEAHLGAWVPAGVQYDLDKNTWTALNLKTVSGLTTSSSYANMIARIRTIFKEGISKYVDLDDVAFHQAFVRFLSGTDNRAKNTYFQMVGPVYVNEVYTEETAAAANEANVDNPNWEPVVAGQETNNIVLPETIDENCYKVRMMGDDLDTVIATDNNGLQSKPYNLLEASYNEDHRKYWGDDNNIFFYMFDQCYEDRIRTLLANIIDSAFSNSDVTNTANYFYKVFFDVQDNQFPAVAYNHQAKIYYENAQFIYDSKIIPVYTNNDVSIPLSLSHGSSAACEKQFMQKRYNFLASYARRTGGNDIYNFASTTGGDGVPEARMVLKFSTYQDFYPTYYWNRDTDVRYLGELQSDADYDISKYLATAGKDYELTLHVNETGINNAIRQTSLYKTLDITGSHNNLLSSLFSHLTDLTMDNANMTSEFFDGWDKTEINTFALSAPVLESLSLRNMNLPTQMDLGSFYKLKTIDLTGTNVQYVLFPQSGRLQNVILPETITEFRIYNNPGLKPYNQELNEGIVFSENLSALKVVYVAANKCGDFDVEDFINKIVDLQLNECTLRNLDVNITLEALNKLLLIPKVNLTGHINIVDEEGQQAQLTFTTLQTLVSMFGDVNSSSNSLYVTYTKEAITTVKAPATLALYGNSGITASVSPIIESGNNVTIVTEDGKSRLNITYALKTSNSFSASTFDTSVATIDAVTGVITLKKESNKKGYIFITVGTDGGDKTTAQTYTCEVSFEWVAPKLGDFAYSDGTFSTSYITSKTLVGIVYAVDENTTTSGTAYILGKEFASDTAYMFGYSGESGSLIASSYPVSSYYLNRYVKTTLGITTPYTGADKGLSSKDDLIAVNSLTKTAYTDAGAEEAPFTGKADTAAYINMVNSEGLPAIYLAYTAVRDRLKSNSDGSYYIANISDFNSVYRTLSNVKIGSDDTANYSDYSQYITGKLATAVLFPYVYAMHLYQPESNEIDPQYLAGNWYVPSLSLLQRVLYLRGISTNDVFTDPNYVRKSIDGSATSDEAIFSKAYNAMGASNFPTCWSTIAGSGASASSGGSSNANNIVTTMNTSAGNNYSYQYTGGSQSWDSSSYSNTWQFGEQPTVNNLSGYAYFDVYYASYPGSLNAWRLTTHLGIPFVEYNYSKPS